MPIYPFQCDCGHSFELNRPITKYPKNPACPACGQHTARRIFQVSIPRLRRDREPILPDSTLPPSGGSNRPQPPESAAAIKLARCDNGSVTGNTGYGFDVLIDATDCNNMTYENNVSHPGRPPDK